VARHGDTDFTVERLIARANEDLANNLGNLVNRTVSMVHRYRGGTVPSAVTAPPAAAFPGATGALRTARATAADAIDAALAEFDFRRAVEAVIAIGDEANRLVEATRPWDLAKAERTGAPHGALDGVLVELVLACRDIAEHLTPFLPAAAARIAEQTGGGSDVLPAPTAVFPRLEMGHAASA
jgi:methionyl-tRNA synthetase